MSNPELLRSCPAAKTGLSRGLAVAFAAAFLAAAPRAEAEKPRPEDAGTSGGSRVVSPAVVATWIARTEPRGLPELELLVLWRGTPGWHLRAGTRGSGSRVSSRSDGGDERGLHVHHLSFGGLDLNLEFDERKRVARIQGMEVALESANVIFVEDVDGPEGPRIARSLHVDSAFPDSPARIEEVVRRSPEIFSFLRCDAKLPDPKMQPMIDAVCEQMKGP